MWNIPTPKMLVKVPDLYSQERVKDKKIYLKFFIGGFTWFVAEIDHKNWDTMFCYTISPQIPHGEWGYTSLKELMTVKSGFVQVDRDVYEVNPYRPKKLSELLRRN